MQDSPITATVDLDRDGVQHGFLKLPHSHDGSAWGNVMIPITVVRNGEGPTALLSGGNHGDEYEGITALLKLANRLQPEQITGRVIIVPMLNHPAVLNGSRTSPLDGGNLNRAFPGNPAGTLTEKIADYLTRYLVPLCDLALDIHSGGRTLDLLPFAATHRMADREFEARCLAAATAFGAPYTLFMAELEGDVLYDSVVEGGGQGVCQHGTARRRHHHARDCGAGGTGCGEPAALCRHPARRSGGSGLAGPGDSRQ